MNCTNVQRLLHPYADGELDLVRQLEIEDHLHECRACGQQEKSLHSLRDALAAPELYYHAPAALRSRLQVATVPLRLRQRRILPRLVAVAAGILLLVTLLGTLTRVLWMSADDRIANVVLADHIRSLQVNHLTDVESSDRHTVKPWFQDTARLDFAPEVPDLSEEDYTLKGGRLDYLADRPVVALVYLRHKHVINLFTWPGTSTKDKTVHYLTRQGYHVRHWQRADMVYWVVSDLNDQELDDFVQLFQQHAAR